MTAIPMTRRQKPGRWTVRVTDHYSVGVAEFDELPQALSAISDTLDACPNGIVTLRSSAAWRMRERSSDEWRAAQEQ